MFRRRLCANALKLLVTVWWKCWLLRRFIMVDNHEVVKIGDLKKTLESLSVVEPLSSADAADVRGNRRGPPVVDED